jgi:hypothetical protein
MLRMYPGRQADRSQKPCHEPVDAKAVTGQSGLAKDEAASDATRYASRKLGPFETVRATIGVLAITGAIFSLLWALDTFVRR